MFAFSPVLTEFVASREHMITYWACFIYMVSRIVSRFSSQQCSSLFDPKRKRGMEAGEARKALRNDGVGRVGKMMIHE